LFWACATGAPTSVRSAAATTARFGKRDMCSTPGVEVRADLLRLAMGACGSGGTESQDICHPWHFLPVH
jgi:hypothetical protein